MWNEPFFLSSSVAKNYEEGRKKMTAKGEMFVEI